MKVSLIPWMASYSFSPLSWLTVRVLFLTISMEDDFYRRTTMVVEDIVFSWFFRMITVIVGLTFTWVSLTVGLISWNMSYSTFSLSPLLMEEDIFMKTRTLLMRISQINVCWRWMMWRVFPWIFRMTTVVVGLTSWNKAYSTFSLFP